MNAHAKQDDPTSEEVEIKMSLSQLQPDVNAIENIPRANQKVDTGKDERNSSFTDQIAEYRDELEADFQKFQESLNNGFTTTDFNAMNWDDLEQQYEADMNVKVIEEQRVMNEFTTHFKQFMLWMQVSNEKESERALKRLRTRAAFVQTSETQLAQKQQHYEKVLGAFQDAMKLLGTL